MHCSGTFGSTKIKCESVNLHLNKNFIDSFDTYYLEHCDTIEHKGTDTCFTNVKSIRVRLIGIGVKNDYYIIIIRHENKKIENKFNKKNEVT